MTAMFLSMLEFVRFTPPIVDDKMFLAAVSRRILFALPVECRDVRALNSDGCYEGPDLTDTDIYYISYLFIRK